jgi:4-diphosphocytidyl-2-C-methyl-D-erythritol kinase
MFRWLAPAKINLNLRVLERRADGYHAIDTIMARVSLADELTAAWLPAAPPGTVEFTCSDPTVPSDDRNLALKAVRALEACCGPVPGLSLHLEKRIPHGAGLGGGSSDAAAVLCGLNEAAGFQLSRRELHDIAATLGSDVPFFLHEGPCRCTGRGEIVAPLPRREMAVRVLLLKPPFAVPTPWAYRAWGESVIEPAFFDAPQQMPWGHDLVNDLERPVFAKYPVLGHLKASLRSAPHVLGAMMSGSGSTMLAFLAPEADATPVVAAARTWLGDEMFHCETQGMV